MYGSNRLWPHLGYCPGTCVEGLRKTTKTPVRAADLPAKNWKRDSLKTKQKSATMFGNWVSYKWMVKNKCFLYDNPKESNGPGKGTPSRNLQIFLIHSLQLAFWSTKSAPSPNIFFTIQNFVTTGNLPPVVCLVAHDCHTKTQVIQPPPQNVAYLTSPNLK
jgi:hypothetical protein